MGRKTSTDGQGRRKPLRRLLALCGLGVAVIGAPLGANAEVEGSRAALDARVAQVRNALQGRSGPDGNSLVEAQPKWANWPNWGNWNNWPNWGNWFNR